MVILQRLAGCILALAFLFSYQAADAHARFVDSVPAANAQLDNPPHEIVLIFSQAVDPVMVALTGPNGKPVETSIEATTVRERVVLVVPQRTEAGLYTVSFHVLAGDSHSIRGDFDFSIIDPELTVSSVSETTAEAPASDEPAAMPGPTVSEAFTPHRIEQIARAVFIAVLLVTIGLVLFRLLIPLSETLDSWAAAQIRVLGAIGASVAIVYFAAVAIGLAGTHIIGLRQLQALLETSIGKSLILAIAGFLVLMASASRLRTSMSIAVALLIISRVVTGHPASQEPGWVLVPAMAVHVAAAGFWVGSLWVLLRVLREGCHADAPRIVDAFSRLALWSVTALLAVGVLTAAVHLKSFDALVNTRYGSLIVWKIGGVTGLLLLAGINKYWFSPRLVARGDRRSLRTSIQVEGVLMLAVIVLSTVLAATAPG